MYINSDKKMRLMLIGNLDIHICIFMYVNLKRSISQSCVTTWKILSVFKKYSYIPKAMQII